MREVEATAKDEAILHWSVILTFKHTSQIRAPSTLLSGAEASPPTYSAAKHK